MGIARAGRAWICSGHDLETLYPQELAAAGMVLCKLQMMRTHPIGGWRLGPTLATGDPTRAAAELERLLAAWE